MVGSSNTALPRSASKPTWKWKLYYAFLAIALIYIVLSGVIASLVKEVPLAKQIEEEQWVSSSRFWLDRQLCRWIGCCGTFHMLNHAGWIWLEKKPDTPVRDFDHFWHAGTEKPDEWSDAERASRDVPQYVLDHAPYVHLYSGETYWPSDVAEHLVHTTPWLNQTEIKELDGTRTLLNLDELNNVRQGDHGRHIYLHSDDNIETLPEWLRSDYNIPPHIEIERLHTKSTAQLMPPGYGESWLPSTDGRCGGQSNRTCKRSGFGNCCSIWGYCGQDVGYCGGDCDPLFGECHGVSQPGRYAPHADLKKRTTFSRGTSGAPAILIVVPKDNGIVDAFWFFFYSYNQGKEVLDIRFGNHVGDWEHTMIRFHHGLPIQAFLSAHSWGAAYDFDALEKYATWPDEDNALLSSWRNATKATFKRPVVFSADGSHAMYGTPDYHDYVAPFGILHDDTDRGPLWDPLRNVKSFTYDVNADIFKSSTMNPDAPTGWLEYAGHWGDRYYLLSDPRQYRFAGEYHYVNGPAGPKFKNLRRKHACINDGLCVVKDSVARDGSIRELHVLHVDEASEEGD